MKYSQKIKNTLFAYSSLVETLVHQGAKYWRRIFRIPHQNHYAALRLIKDSPQNLYLDVGANLGQSIESIRMFKNNPIISFEANPILAKTLTTQYPDITINSYGLGKEPGKFILHIPAYRHVLFKAYATLKRENAERFLNIKPVLWFNQDHARIEEVECQLVTLDSLGLTPSFIKIDVEGTELSVIEGGMETIRQNLPILMVEHANQNIMEKLNPLGYKKYKYSADKLITGESKGDSILIPKSKESDVVLDIIANEL